MFGVVDAPALGVIYWGGKDLGSYKIDNDIERPVVTARKKCKTNDMNIVGSRSH